MCIPPEMVWYLPPGFEVANSNDVVEISEVEGAVVTMTQCEIDVAEQQMSD